MEAVPIELKQANEFVDKHHRHHDSVHRDKFRIGCEVNGKLVGVIQLARPVSRILDDGKTIEVVRLCTDGTSNVCSFLYSRTARIAAEMGYQKIITYILESESGVSLKACGWHKEADTNGHNWSCRSRPRNTTAPTCNKQRWAKDLRGGMLLCQEKSQVKQTNLYQPTNLRSVLRDKLYNFSKSTGER